MPRKVLERTHYDLIIKPSCIEFVNNNVDNLFVAVAKEMNITVLPQNLLSIGNAQWFMREQ
jgi:hypothetical protein